MGNCQGSAADKAQLIELNNQLSELKDTNNQQSNLLKYKIEVLQNLLALSEQKYETERKRLETSKLMLLQYGVTNNTFSDVIPSPVKSNGNDTLEFYDSQSIDFSNALIKFSEDFQNYKEDIISGFANEDGKLNFLMNRKDFVRSLYSTTQNLSKSDAQVLSLRFIDKNNTVSVAEFLDYFSSGDSIRNARAANSVVRLSKELLVLSDHTEEAPPSTVVTDGVVNSDTAIDTIHKENEVNFEDIPTLNKSDSPMKPSDIKSKKPLDSLIENNQLNNNNINSPSALKNSSQAIVENSNRTPTKNLNGLFNKSALITDDINLNKKNQNVSPNISKLSTQKNDFSGSNSIMDNSISSELTSNVNKAADNSPINSIIENNKTNSIVENSTTKSEPKKSKFGNLVSMISSNKNANNKNIPINNKDLSLDDSKISLTNDSTLKENENINSQSITKLTPSSNIDAKSIENKLQSNVNLNNVKSMTLDKKVENSIPSDSRQQIDSINFDKPTAIGSDIQKKINNEIPNKVVNAEDNNVPKKSRFGSLVSMISSNKNKSTNIDKSIDKDISVDSLNVAGSKQLANSKSVTEIIADTPETPVPAVVNKTSKMNSLMSMVKSSNKKAALNTAEDKSGLVSTVTDSKLDEKQISTSITQQEKESFSTNDEK